MEFFCWLIFFHADFLSWQVPLTNLWALGIICYRSTRNFATSCCALQTASCVVSDTTIQFLFSWNRKIIGRGVAKVLVAPFPTAVLDSLHIALRLCSLICLISSSITAKSFCISCVPLASFFGESICSGTHYCFQCLILLLPFFFCKLPFFLSSTYVRLRTNTASVEAIVSVCCQLWSLFQFEKRMSASCFVSIPSNHSPRFLCNPPWPPSHVCRPKQQWQQEYNPGQNDQKLQMLNQF